MLKRVLIIATLSVGEGCLATQVPQSPKTDFIAFINGCIDSDLRTLKQTLTSAEPTELIKKFVNDFGPCFDGNVVSEKSGHTDLEVFYSAARTVGMGYFRYARKNSDLTSIKIAMAFLQSIPTESVSVGAVHDVLDIDYVKMAEQEKDTIKRRISAASQIAEFALEDCF